jgi:uncharacterized Ntn-hydrolase superfamily protein
MRVRHLVGRQPGGVANCSLFRVVVDLTEVGRGALQALKQATRWNGELQQRQVFLQ